MKKPLNYHDFVYAVRGITDQYASLIHEPTLTYRVNERGLVMDIKIGKKEGRIWTNEKGVEVCFQLDKHYHKADTVIELENIIKNYIATYGNKNLVKETKNGRLKII